MKLLPTLAKRFLADMPSVLVLFWGMTAICTPNRIAVAEAFSILNQEPFSFVNQTVTQPLPSGNGIHGLAKVGTSWFAANFNNGWNVYDASFVQTGTTTVPGLGNTRGLAFDSKSGNLYAGNFDTNTIFEVTPSGTIVNSFSSAGTNSGLNAIAYNPIDDSVYAVHFNGFVNRFSSGGVHLNSFTIAGQSLTGAAIDSVRNTLLVLVSGDDSVREYTTLGSLVGIPLAADAVSGNGQGLQYESATGLLHVTSQEGNIAIWQRQVVPEPASAILLSIGLAFSIGHVWLIRFRRRRVSK